MKQKIKFALLLMLVCTCFACKEKAPKVKVEDTIVDPRMDWNMTRSKQDTTTVIEMAKDYLDLLKKQEYESAMHKLSEMVDSVPEPLTDKRRAELLKVVKSFPVYSYKIKEVLFYSENDTEVRYEIELFEKEEGNEMPNTISGVLNPKRYNGKWYLTVSERTREDNFKE